ncbi:MAG: hypothetical protein LUQ66_00760 [Methanoregula sp.]|nr:hypothetical protein [Methanoregula sp.]
MKKIVLLMIGLLFLSGTVSAYKVYINAPDSLAVGKPLVVTGTTTIGVGTTIDVVLYHQMTTTSQVKRLPVTVQSDTTFKAIFDTTGLKPGVYKVEVPSPGSGDSISMRLVTLYDRSDEISMTYPLNQSFTGKIYIAGEIRGLEDSGVQIEVIDPYGLVVFGPQYINTDNNAHFAAEIPIALPGTYEVSFIDSKGYIGSRTVTTLTEGGAAPAYTPATTSSAVLVVRSAQSRSSRDSPAYFIVSTGTGPVTLYTSESLDWVIEYIDDRGVLHMVNDRGNRTAEKVLFQGNGKTIYVKIYPYMYAVADNVILYGENVNSVAISPTVPAPFEAAKPEATTARAAPLTSAIPVLSAALAAVVLSLKKAD